MFPSYLIERSEIPVKHIAHATFQPGAKLKQAGEVLVEIVAFRIMETVCKSYAHCFGQCANTGGS